MIVKRIQDNLSLEDGIVRLLGIWDTTLENSAAITAHLHRNIEEVYYVIEGMGKMTIDDEEKNVADGDVIYSSDEDPYTCSVWREASSIHNREHRSEQSG